MPNFSHFLLNVGRLQFHFASPRERDDAFYEKTGNEYVASERERLYCRTSNALESAAQFRNVLLCAAFTIIIPPNFVVSTVIEGEYNVHLYLSKSSELTQQHSSGFTGFVPIKYFLLSMT